MIPHDDLDDPNDPRTEPTAASAGTSTSRRSAGLRLEAYPLAGLPLAHARIPLVQALHVRNPSPMAWQDVVVEIRSEPAFSEPWTHRFERLDPYRPHALSPKLSLDPLFFANQTDRSTARLVTTLTVQGEVRDRHVHDLTLLPPSHWPGVNVLPVLLAGWVRPMSPAVPPLLTRTADRLEALIGERGMDGYQSGDPKRVWRMVQASWEAMQQVGLDYVNPPPSFEQAGQKILTPSQVLTDRLGCCLDLAVTMASLWERMGLHPFVVVVKGHAFAGVWLTEFSLPDPVLDDPRPLRKRIDLGEALVVDSSPVTGSGSFDDARKRAEARLASLEAFLALVDVRAARTYGVHPMPGDGEVAASARQGGRERDVAQLGSTLPEGRWVGKDDTLPERRTDRVDQWKGRLLDLSLRNRLLNLKPGPSVVSMPFCDPATLEDRLADGGTLELLPRPELRVTDASDAEERERLRTERLREAGLELQREGRILVDLPAKAADAALLGLFRSARTAYQESGATTLYLTIGALSWFESPSSTQPRLAPLLLVPVELVRGAAPGAWSLKAAEEESRVNVTLLEKLRVDFGLDTTGLDILPEDDHGIDVPLLLARFRKAIKALSAWEVTDDVWLGQFSFAKFLMWLDLEAKRDDLAKNPIVSQLFAGASSDAGPSHAPVRLVDEAKLDSERPTVDTLTVMDADPSQLQAILAAMDGASFVLQGPPGTGKSQTITNLIAQLLADGKTVLFVSEKLAALDVVQRRLERVGMGPFCLELHAHQGSKRMVAEQLKQAFAYANQRSPEDWEARTVELQRHRDALNAHAARLAAPSPFGVSTRDVLASLFGLRDVPLVPLDVDVARLDPGAVEARRTASHQLAVALQDVGDLSTHPWRGVRHATWAPAWARDVLSAVGALRSALETLQATLGPAREQLSLPDQRVTPDRLDALTATARLLLDSPAPPRALLAESGARDRLAELRTWVAEGVEVAAAREALRVRWRDDLLDLDLEGLLQRHRTWGRVFVVRVVTLFGARRTLKAVATGALPDEATITADLEAAIALRAGKARLESHADDARRWLGRAWAAVDSDWGAVQSQLDWADRVTDRLLAMAVDPELRQVHARLLELATDQADLVRPGGPLRAVFERLVAARQVFDAARARLVELVQLHAVEAWGAEPTLVDLATWCAQALASGDRLRAWCAGAEALEGMRKVGLEPLVHALSRGELTTGQLERATVRALREAWWTARLEADPELARFRGMRHADLVARFRHLEAETRRLAELQAAAKVAARVPDLQGPGDELGLLRRELMKKRGHLPVRKLFERIGPVLQRVKPCVLMSPLSVAQFLDPSQEGYDVVVFDEASQIPPWDAVGAIARGRQAIIVGDSKQLPPTTFFSRTVEDEPDEDDLVELESVLDEAVASGILNLRLRWHYRSRHESLIAFSNFHYYDNKLHTFPSADHNAPGVGVSFHHVADGYYDRGGSRTNRKEAEAVVACLLDLLKQPEDRRPSVGIVTFSMAQQHLILDLVEQAQREHPELTPCFADGTDEPVFIKNLENVQGDERDVMLFSIGYGPDAQGKVTLNLGPLTRDGGERRLNVAVTRARERLLVFSSLRHDMIRPAATSSLGVHHLKHFLAYAEQGRGALDGFLEVSGELVFESPFEEEVHAFLTARGYQVDTQVGSSGYRIDLAVVHPDRPGCYVLAVECDGATYHGSANARERDRLRDQVLEQLGWRIHRVWSTDWWYEPEASRPRLLAAVEDAIRTFAEAVAPAREAPEPKQAHVKPADVDALLAERPKPPTLPGHAVPWAGLPSVRGGAKDDFHLPQSARLLRADLLTVVVSAGPVSRDDAYRHVAQAWGWSGLGKRIVQRCDDVLLTRQEGSPTLRDDMLWPAGMKPEDYRGFRPVTPGGPTRDVQAIPLPELANALAWLVSQGVSMSTESAMRETGKLFGLHHLGKHVSGRLEGGLARAVSQGLVREEQGRLFAV